LLDGATSIDLEGHTQLAYGTKRFFSAERWGLVGDAAAFTDPFYSPGSDFIALQCDLLTDLIRRETGGEAPASMAERTDLYDAFMQSRWDATMRVYRGLYSTFGSYELMKVKFNFDLGCYFNLLFGPFACDWHLDLKYLKSELRRRRETGIIMGNFADLFRQVERHLWRNGAYHRGNLGRHDLGVECILPLIGEVTETRKKSLIDRRTEAIFNYGRGEALKLLGRDGVEPPLRIHEFADPRPLVSSMCEAAEQVSSHRAGRGK
jgi:hypothetical protein